MSSLLSRNWESLTRPSTVDVVQSNPENSSAVIEIYPLEQGMGTTIGNSLRRVLLSSLQGFAVHCITVEGVAHEFETIPGVKQDVVDIVFGIKRLVISSENAEDKTLRISAVGPCVVTAGDISVPDDVTILNKDLPICDIEEGASINMELHVSCGKGYVAVENRKSNSEADVREEKIGKIYLDTLYCPVKRVAYSIESSRVGNDLSYDKLVMKIETNGSVSPENALGYAAKILQRQLDDFINFDDVLEEGDKQEDEFKFDKKLFKRVEELELSVRSQNCLKNESIMYIGDLVCKTESQMLKTPNFGRKSLNELKALLSNMGLMFGMKNTGWPPEDLEYVVSKLSSNQY